MARPYLSQLDSMASLEIDALTVTLLGGILCLALLFRHQEPDLYPGLLREQALASPTRSKGSSAVYRNKNTPHSLRLLDSLKDANTVYDMFWSRVERDQSREFLGYCSASDNRFHYLSYKQVAERVNAFGRGLVKSLHLLPRAAGAAVGPRQLVAVFMKNCLEWVISDYALVTFGLVSVPIHDGIDSESLSFVLAHTGVPCLVTSSENLDTVFAVLAKSSQVSLETIVVADPLDPSSPWIAQAQKLGLKLVGFAQVEEQGRKETNVLEHIVPAPEDVFTICYTSGTSGHPKGVELTHRNMVVWTRLG
ncbi:Long-chain-fatty-acid--CoA ligase 6 [Kappamyces sp. JEL0680]|nr:Long-chain-fatty-acid--CoA ligase 6 [Kappamyces sp. JEL0680]